MTENVKMLATVVVSVCIAFVVSYVFFNALFWMVKV